jgi:uncharacterized protein (TIGR04255 family)
MAENKLPSFARPPVVEVVLGVNFAQHQRKLGIPHFGLYWNQVRNDLKNVAVQPPISIASEEMEPGSTVLQFSNEVEVPRCWFKSDDGQNIVQIQQDWFLFNWCQVEPAKEYPRYSKHVRPGFELRWKQFREFLKSADLSSPTALQCEVTYVNRIMKGQGWDSFADVHNVTNLLASQASHWLPRPDSGRCSFKYSLPTGNLTITIQLVAEAIVMQVTARSKPAGSADDDILACLDEAHQWVVKAFADITTEQMHAVWGRTH